MNKTHLANLPSGITMKIRYELKLTRADFSTWDKYRNLNVMKNKTKEEEERMEELGSAEVLPEFGVKGVTFFDGRPINLMAIETSIFLSHRDFIAAQAEYAAFIDVMSAYYISISDYEHEEDLPF